ncbi:zinc-finger of the MIZ type in Nse subunit-domain-containing protein, partial [Coniochaeta sp. 2T2.1]
MAPGRLLQQGRRRAEHSSAPGRGSGSGRQNNNVASSDELPPYEAPSQPLNDAARRALAQISNNRTTRKLDDHLKKSTELIRDAVGATNDRAFENHAALQQRAEKSAPTREGKTAADAELETYVTAYNVDVSAATAKLEAALRDIIDYKVELEDEPQVLGTVRDELEAQARDWKPRGLVRKKKKEPREGADGEIDVSMADAENAEEDEDEEDEDVEQPEDQAPVSGVNEVLDQVRQTKANDWANMEMGHRYASHKDYVLFKRTLHDAQHPDDGATLPHASAWFGPDGQPVLSKVGEVDAPADDEDDELQIAGEVRSFRCPLSMAIMAEPYSNNNCKHTFDKKSISEYLGNSRAQKQCPEAGCSQMLTLNDFFLDKILLRKIKRQRAADEQKE